jgi:uncharacterized membrane protein YgcG
MVSEDSGSAPPPRPQVLDEARGLLVRRFTFPVLPFAFMHRIHSVLKLDAWTEVALGFTWGALRSRTRGKERCEVVYRLDRASVFPPEQFDPAQVGTWHSVHPGDVSDVLTVEGNDEALFNVTVGFVRRAIGFFDGLRHAAWVETPFASKQNRVGLSTAATAGDVPRRIHVRLDARLEAVLRTQRPHTIAKLPCLPGPFDVAELRCNAPPFAFVSYEWSKSREVDALQTTMEQRLHLRCWRDKERFVAGDRLDQGMVAGIAASQLVIVCLTRAYLKSANCLLEYRAMRELGKPLVLLVLEPGGLPTAKVLLREAKDDVGWNDTAKAQWDEFHDRARWLQSEFDALVDLARTNFLALKMWSDDGALEDMYADGAWAPGFARRLRDAIDRAVAEVERRGTGGGGGEEEGPKAPGSGGGGNRGGGGGSGGSGGGTPRTVGTNQHHHPPSATLHHPDGSTTGPLVDLMRVTRLEVENEQLAARLAEERGRVREEKQRAKDEIDRSRSERERADDDRERAATEIARLRDENAALRAMAAPKSKACAVQ